MKIISNAAIVAALSSFIAVGCSSGEPSHQSQRVDCPIDICPDGQHCETDIDGFKNCQLGCLVDTDCPDHQTCNTATGACGSGGTSTPPAPTTPQPASECDGVCAKVVACGLKITSEQCASICPSQTEDCHTCVMSTPCAGLKSCSSCGF
jgi:hypothetical protein